MAKHAKRIGIQAVGLAFMLLGVLGILLPVVNGSIFIILGLILLSIHSTRIKKFLHTQSKRHPKAEAAVQRMEAFILKWVGEEVKQ